MYGWASGLGFCDGDIGEWKRKEGDWRCGVYWQGWRGGIVGGWQGGRAGKTISDYVLFARKMHKISGKFR
jgi:hypothetical protein